jgi:hexokinase
MYFPNKKNNLLGGLLSNDNNEDRITLYYLIDRLIERVAKLTAINLASVVLKEEKGIDPCIPVCITAEGTTFYKLKNLKSKVEYYMKEYLINEKNRYIEIINVENATLIGAAIAGLTN